MTSSRLAELTAAATVASDPTLVSASIPRLGGVDPLGLRQLNFDLMDRVLPGLNNVARHIRPFVVVSWAWRRAVQLARSRGADLVQGQLVDFVDRIEVLYVWSQFLKNPNADLPGRQVLGPLLEANEYRFGGDTWEQRRKTRRDSTALSAAINYGPGLAALGWLVRDEHHTLVRHPSPRVTTALDAFESRLSGFLENAAFSELDAVVVSRDEAMEWADAWDVESPTTSEAEVMRQMLVGASAHPGRRNGVQLLVAASKFSKSHDVGVIRSTMAAESPEFTPDEPLTTTETCWRELQMRQLFRLSLEALFHWSIGALDGPPQSTEQLTDLFITQLADPPLKTTRQWLDAAAARTAKPTEAIDGIQDALRSPDRQDLADRIVDGLALSLSEAVSPDSRLHEGERLPVFKAQQDVKSLAGTAPPTFVRHVFESWILAQHSYWSVRRGLADARAAGKTLLRLKIILDEGGWTLTPGALRAAPPRATPDRLQTAISLSLECGLIT